MLPGAKILPSGKEFKSITLKDSQTKNIQPLSQWIEENKIEIKEIEA